MMRMEIICVPSRMKDTQEDGNLTFTPVVPSALEYGTEKKISLHGRFYENHE